MNEDQRQAYDIIIYHLQQTLTGHQIEPLRMIIYGEGGTGKSKVLQSVTEAFRQRAVLHLLVKAAYTGVAASLIDGKTTHVIAGISCDRPRSETKISNEAKTKLSNFWKFYQYLFLDEMSMLAKDFFAMLSRNISVAKSNPSNSSFGEVNVIILGDFHQFPPVARSIRDALFYPSNAENDSQQSQIGCSIYEEFSKVVILTEQKRVIDPVWLDFLRHLRSGKVKREHLKMLQTLAVGETEIKLLILKNLHGIRQFLLHHDTLFVFNGTLQLYTNTVTQMVKNC